MSKCRIRKPLTFSPFTWRRTIQSWDYSMPNCLCPRFAVDTLDSVHTSSSTHSYTGLVYVRPDQLYFSSLMSIWMSHKHTILTASFLAEATRRLRENNGGEDDCLTAAGCMFLSFGLACDGRNTLGQQFKAQGLAMSERLGLFGANDCAHRDGLDKSLSANDYSLRAHVAWGIFNWLCLQAIINKDNYPTYRPSYAIPAYVVLIATDIASWRGKQVRAG